MITEIDFKVTGEERKKLVSIPIEISILFGNSEHPFPERKEHAFPEQSATLYLILRRNLYSIFDK